MLKSISILTIMLILINSIKTDSSSFDSLISSQCKARCLSLYPWKSNTTVLERMLRSTDRSNNYYFNNYNNNNNKNMAINKRFSNQSESNNNHGIKWNKVMEMCSKNSNCLQCSLPCEIPTNLLSNCKYLCKNRHPLCIESCNLLLKLTEDKYGSCPAQTNIQLTSSIIGSFESNSFGSSNLEQKCSNKTKQDAIANLIRKNFIDNDSNSKAECFKDSDCGDIRKCCSINPECPEHGNVCQKPVIKNLNLPSIPFNLTITERKKGKTVILSWDCTYNKNKPTLFVVEGRWSLKSPLSSQIDNSDNSMTKWGYLAQTTNNNWVILRSINRGRWYKFRVAAISKSGTYGYSQPTELFILSSAPKPPSQPQNLTITQTYQSLSDPNSVNAEISWLPSKRSDLPITDYKITWSLRPNGTSNDDSYFRPNEYDESDEESSTDDQSQDNQPVASKLQSDSSGSDTIDAQGSNKYTIKNLFKNSIYSVELIAMSKYESKYLYSQPIRVRLDTSILNPIPISSSLVSDRFEDEDDDDMTYDTENSDQIEQNKQQITPRNSQETNKIPMIKNLTVQTPYFQNGLVKAKLSWQIEQENTQDNYLSQQQASIYSKTLIDQPMFTITWFAIKCFQMDKSQDLITLPQKQLPTPITATTINTFFEIYELKYNCDYVVNVRLANNINKQASIQSSLSNNAAKSAIPPQISSAQFKVPSCANIKILGRIRPICYERNSLSDTFESIPETTQSSSTRKNFNQDIYKLLLSTATNRPTTTLTKITVSEKKSEYSLYSNLPKVTGIRYKIVDRQLNKNLYAVEFIWSMSNSKNLNLFTGYQISVVPKEIPGIGSSNFEGGYFGSVGAIVTKDQQSFIVRQLSPSIRYIFQIQTIGSDGQSYGPVSNLEFLIDDKTKLEGESSNQINRIDYDLPNSDLLFQSTSSSIPDYYQFSRSSSVMKNNFLFNSLFIVLLQVIFMNQKFIFN